jgi:hypothetical protein
LRRLHPDHGKFHRKDIPTHGYLTPFSRQYSHNRNIAETLAPSLVIIRKLRPYLSDFADSISRKERHPKSDMARDNFRFLTIPDVFKSSKIIVIALLP